ncbi:putative DNA polymerase eta [Leptomonas pyrrhocoris]|uniref:Putative DNA polymerase eta n=1 Tax=Leptomonas pyrrhocoris TaxID=157538 RepID=A0A0M9FXX1_LEPPY|nr:putative DNA polymerase eta [Leptomonas pyrrhocoris]KPA78189.1 putative DNA polymerase eta [Leptomonas pyrrhocoris]|eukprot:XP_015656628.1 putative DNA polymerase eta [Leptomonas pyrrhocoris]
MSSTSSSAHLHADSTGGMRCIAHLDMDCFYAQVEAVRLGVNCRTVPLVLSQWESLIAVNYPARKYGIKRGQHNAIEAKQMCPDLVVALSPSYRVGESVSQYHPNPTRDYYKISLEPYRLASRKFFAIIASAPGVQVEKGGVDEAYIDVTEAAQRELAAVRAAAGGPDVALDALRDVMEPSTRLIGDRRAEMQAWFGERGTSLEAVFDAPMRALLRGERGRAVEGSRGFCVDGDDGAYAARCLLLCAASRVVHRLRQRIYAELHYDCSAGIAHNRVLAKCISATHKPNQQTLLLPDRSASALFELPLTRLRGFGGKFGAAVSAVCGGATDCRDLWMVPLPQLYALDSSAFAPGDDDDGGDDEDGGGSVNAQRPRRSPAHFTQKVLGDDGLVTHDLSVDAYYRMRGVAEDTIVNRPLSKTLIASKNFGFLTSSVDTIQRWVVVLCGELCSRYDEFTALYHLRGRNWNIKLGNEGFRRMGGVMNYTVALPDVVQPDILAAVTKREIQSLFREKGGAVSADSVTLTMGGFVSDNSGAMGLVPSLSAISGAKSDRQPPRQRTLHSFLHASSLTADETATTNPSGSAAAATVRVAEQISDSSADEEDDEWKGEVVICHSSTSSNFDPFDDDGASVQDSDVVSLSLPSQRVVLAAESCVSAVQTVSPPPSSVRVSRPGHVLGEVKGEAETKAEGKTVEQQTSLTPFSTSVKTASENTTHPPLSSFKPSPAVVVEDTAGVEDGEACVEGGRCDGDSSPDVGVERAAKRARKDCETVIID